MRARPRPVPASTEQMWSGWKRPGIPQAPLGHTFLPGFRMLLTERAPDVVERLYAAGAPLLDYAQDMPGDERRPEDAELRAIMCRRAVLEGILRQTVAAEPTVGIRTGCDVVGLVAEPSPMPGVPRVVGVRTRDRAIAADTVVVAGGRLVPVPRWLEAIGAHAPEEFTEGCGFVTFTRFFRINLRPDKDHRVSTRLSVEGDPGYMSYELFRPDASTFCVELSPPAWDHELRGLRHEAVHMRRPHAARERGLARPRPGDPIGPVAAMGQERTCCATWSPRSTGGAWTARDRRRPLPARLALRLGLGRGSRRRGHACRPARRAPRRPRGAGYWPSRTGSVPRSGAGTSSRSPAIAPAPAATAASRSGTTPKPASGSWGTRSSPPPTRDPDVYRAVMRSDMQLDPVGALLENTAVIDRARALAAARNPEPKAAPAPARERLLELIAQAGGPAVE